VVKEKELEDEKDNLGQKGYVSIYITSKYIRVVPSKMSLMMLDGLPFLVHLLYTLWLFTVYLSGSSFNCRIDFLVVFFYDFLIRVSNSDTR